MGKKEKIKQEGIAGSKVNNDVNITEAKKKNRKKRLKKIAFLLFSLIVIFFLIAIALYGYVDQELASAEVDEIFEDEVVDLQAKYNKLYVKSQLHEDIQSLADFEFDTVNFLIFGLDKGLGRNYNAYRSDTIMVASMNFANGNVDLISIPRDSYVPIYSRYGGKDKINACFYYGSIFGETGDEFVDGVEFLKNTVSGVLGGIPIHYYIYVDMDVVKEIVDAMGGVEIEVHKDIKEDDGKSSEIAINSGLQVLDGKDLLYYARYRHYPQADIDRIDVQQNILKAVYNQFKNSNKFSTIPKIYESVKENLDTNLSFMEIVSTAYKFKEMEININTYTLPGDFGNLGGISYWILDQDERVDFVEELFGIKTERWYQDPTSDKLLKLIASADYTTISVGAATTLYLSGDNAAGGHPTFNVGKVNVSVSDSSVLSVSGNVATGLAPGSATITFEEDGVSTTLTITVMAESGGDGGDGGEEDPPADDGEDPPADDGEDPPADDSGDGSS